MSSVAGSNTQCFPFYTYAEDGSNRRENITDWALEQFRTQYNDDRISKWDIFHYVYALLHHPQYREKYAANLKRELPRIPFAPDFRGFAEAGARLAELHVNYEKQPEYPLQRLESKDEKLNWRVEKMKLSKDKTQLVYNDFLTLGGIPPEVFEYRLGNRSALDWIVDQYQVSTDKRSGIVNDPNRARRPGVHRAPHRPGDHGQPGDGEDREGTAGAGIGGQGMDTKEIGKLEKVPLRDIWKGEAKDFTRWLEENIDTLNEALDLSLTSPEREKHTGPFNVDLTAEDADGNRVVIECQLEKTDHDHLGKLVTYLSTFDAKTAIWICKDPRTPHAKAVDWLNESTPPDISFYLVKVEGVRIGSSPAAPLFTVIFRPTRGDNTDR